MCLQPIFVPKKLLSWPQLLFLGDRTNCLLCVAALVISLSFTLCSPLISFPLSFYFCDCYCIINQKWSKNVFLLGFLLPSHTLSHDQIVCVSGGWHSFMS